MIFLFCADVVPVAVVFLKTPYFLLSTTHMKPKHIEMCGTCAQ